MMQCYTRSPLLVLAFKDNHEAAVPVSAGKIIEVVYSGLDETFVTVIVNGEEFHAFADDVRTQCTLLLWSHALSSSTRSAAA